MSDDCFFNPAACEEVEPEPVVEPVAEETTDEVMMEEEEEGMWEPTDEEKAWMFEGNLAFLLLSFGGMFGNLMDFMSWKWAYTVDYTVDGDDYNDMVEYYGEENGLFMSEEIDSQPQLQAGMIATYGGLAIWTLAFVTQALSMAGIAVGLNMMVWGYGVMLGGAIVSLISTLLLVQSWFKAWGEIADDSEEYETFGDYADTAEYEIIKMSAAESAVTLTAWMYIDAWSVAQWYALPEEEKQAMWDEKEAEEDGKEMMLRRLF